MNNDNMVYYKNPVILSQKLNTLINLGDKNNLEKEIMKNVNVINEINDKDLFRTEVIACVFVQNYILALNSLKKINKYYRGADELTGMIYYNIGEYHKAFKFLDNTPKYLFNSTSTILKSLCAFECGKEKISSHEKNLEKILPTSSTANTFLGILCYNNEKYLDSAIYFGKASVLSKNDESSRLNALRALYHYDEISTKNEFQKFYEDTKSKLSQRQLMLELNKEKLSQIKLNITEFHIIAKNLLYY